MESPQPPVRCQAGQPRHRAGACRYNKENLFNVHRNLRSRWASRRFAAGPVYCCKASKGSHLKFLVVDDHPLFRQGLISVLAQLQETVQCLEATNQAGARQMLEQHPDLDLLLLDLQLPDIDGLALLAQLRASHPDLPIAIISASEERDKVVCAMRLGAMGFIPKSASVQILGSALQLILDGGVYLPPAIMLDRPVGLQTLPTATPEAALAQLGLSSRPLQVMKLMAQGASNKLIARELDIAENTVKAHIATIFRALNVATRSQAIATLGRMGITFHEH